jgi:capsular exopolysaccharide synthesis family protein
MSQIFDALLRSEAERAGTNEVTQAESTRLLESVERQALSKASGAFFNASEKGASGGNNFLFGGEIVLDAAESFEEIHGAGVEELNVAANFLEQSRPLSIPLSSENRFVCLSDKGSPAAEAFRLLAVRLRNLRQARPLKQLLITSTVPREGKSTVAANLACVLSQRTEERVLLLEGDVRRPSLTQMFDLREAPGICEVLQGKRSLQDGICRIEGAGPWILPAGSAPSAPLELLQSKKLPALLEQLNVWFDWVVIDSPPILPLADTSVWARLIDGILLVTRQGVTEKQQLTRGIQALEPGKFIGALLNCSKVSTYSSYYYRSSPNS